MSKVAIVGDIHIGNNKNNPIFHDIVLKYGEWLKKELNDRGIDTIWQLGDIFHDRVSINLLTLNTAYKFFDILQNFNITIVVGNHDSFYLHNSSIHSLSFLKKWPNIFVADVPVVTKDGVALCPWGTSINDINKNKITLGHFEIQAFAMNANKICTKGLRALDLMNKCDILFSGHFHKPQERQYDGKPLIYAGSCFQQNWGESGEDKFFYILDTETLEYEKIENKMSPRFEYIKTEDDYNKVENNFISIDIFDLEDEFDIVNKFEKMKPLDIRIQYKERNKNVSTENIAIEQFQLVRIEDSIEEVINALEGYADDEKEEINKRTNILYGKHRKI